MTHEVTSLLGRLPASYARRGGGVLRRYLAIAEGLVADFERLDSRVARERAVAALVPTGLRGGADLRRGPVPAPGAIWPALVVRESGGRLLFHRTFDRAVILAWDEAGLCARM